VPTATPVPTTTPVPTPVPTNTPAPTPTPTPTPCIVPQLVGQAFTKNNWDDGSHLKAQWLAAGFTGAITPNPSPISGSGSQTHHVVTQIVAPVNISAGSAAACTSSLTFTYSTP
jgi:hypothetical protein